jgi:hypothetical protein
MTTNIIIPEDLEEIINDILAQESLEQEEKENSEGELERVYIEDIIPEIKDDEEQKEAWKIEITI